MGVGDYSLNPFTLPIAPNPVAMQVRNNDNLMRQKFNAHQADVVAHPTSGELTSRPASTGSGAIYVVTDASPPEVYIDLPAGWTQIGGGGGGGVTGSGTAGTLTKWATSTSLTDSIVTETTGLITVTGGIKVTLGGLFGPSTTTQNDPDDYNFLAETLYLDSVNQRVGIGTDTPEATLSIHSQGTGNTRGVSGRHWDNSTAFSQFKYIGGRARGTVGSPSAVLANDTLVSFNARGYKATDWSNTVGGFYIYAAANWTDSSTETFMTWRGVATGAGTTVTEWMRLSNAGRLLVNTSVQTPLLFNTGALLIVGTTSAHTLDFYTNNVLQGRMASGGALTLTQQLVVGADYGANFGNGDIRINTWTGTDAVLWGWNNNQTSGYRRAKVQIGAGVDISLLSDAGAVLYSILTASRSVGGGAMTLGGTGVNSITAQSPLITPASSTSAIGFRLPHGTAPTSLTNGDVWTTTAGMYARINGATVGPFSAGWTTQAAVADATGGTVQDSEARTALNSLLAKLRTINIISP